MGKKTYKLSNYIKWGRVEQQRQLAPLSSVWLHLLQAPDRRSLTRKHENVFSNQNCSSCQETNVILTDLFEEKKKLKEIPPNPF